MNDCPVCGSSVDPNARFCPECGSPLPSRETREDVDSVDRGSTDQNDVGSLTSPPSDGDESMFTFPILYPSRGGFTTVLIGTILALFFWLLIPSFILAGYFVRLTRAAGRGEPKPPAFDDWIGMLVEGVVLFLVLIPVGILYGILVYIAMEIHVAVFLVVAIAAAYPIPAIYMNYSVENDWKAAYDLSTIGDQITTEPYLVGILLYVFIINGIGSIFATIFLVLSVFTIVGWIVLWPMIYFYWYGIDAALWGRVYYRIQSG